MEIEKREKKQQMKLLDASEIHLPNMLYVL